MNDVCVFVLEVLWTNRNVDPICKPIHTLRSSSTKTKGT